MIWGPIGREILFVGYWLYLVFVAGAGLLAISTALNAVSDHAICTALFTLVGAATVMLIASIQTLDRISWITWVGVMGIMTSVITLTIAVSQRDRPYAAPQTGPWDKQLKLWGDAPFVDCCAAVAAIIFSYAGAPAFFSVVAEMKNPRQFTRSLLVCQAVVISTFTIVAAVVYHYCGVYLSSPTLGSAGGVIKKVCYGFALPGLIAGAVLNTHIPAKLLMVRFLRNSEHLANNTKVHYIVWFSCIAFNASISFIIAEAIPVFNNLLSVVGAFLATPLSMTVECLMYMWEVRRKDEQPTMRGRLMYGWNFFIFVLSLFAIGTGMWASAMAIKGDIDKGNLLKPFGCADNSGFHPAS